MIMIDIERSPRNVYADLGFHDAAETLVKAQLVAKISEILTTRKWPQQQVGKVLGIPQPKLSKMLRGQFRGISKTKMPECLTKLGRDIRIVISSEESGTVTGSVQVISA
jgi:predicted XRE-type DNA-binding protein